MSEPRYTADELATSCRLAFMNGAAWADTAMLLSFDNLLNEAARRYPERGPMSAIIVRRSVSDRRDARDDMSATHELKTWRMYFDDVESGRKTFEYRADDREPRFEVGDVLHLREWGGASMDYTGRECWRAVTYVARGGPIIPAGFCIMSIAPLSRTPTEGRQGT